MFDHEQGGPPDHRALPLFLVIDLVCLLLYPVRIVLGLEALELELPVFGVVGDNLVEGELAPRQELAPKEHPLQDTKQILHTPVPAAHCTVPRRPFDHLDQSWPCSPGVSGGPPLPVSAS